MPSLENRLKFEKSPYLLQHKDNPVHWFSWGEEAFETARRENKPIFLSIGYSTCHWCHVMEHESFEKQEVADVLNRHFVSIKLDREERPDIDEIYMAALQAMKQRGGWPLSVFMTPDLKPFYGGTYFPKEHFIALLEHMAQLWREQPEKVKESGDSLAAFLLEQKGFELNSVPLDEEVFRAFYRHSLITFDKTWGGFGSAPKFPHPMQLSLLLRIHRRTSDADALRMTTHSLDCMARGGIYDHLGFGFSRYSTDARWLVPHFEKMLYDNALLAVTYLEAFQVTRNEMYARVARECLEYTLRVMTHPEGGFFSAEDADSEGEEGKFYLWSWEEVKNALSPEELQTLARVYQISERGNFEGKNILELSRDLPWQEKDSPLVKSAADKLFKIREARIHPHKDDKILTSWNGLMIRAMALGFQALQDPKYLHAAKKAAAFLRNNLWREGMLHARFREGESRFDARLEDYAFLIQALLDLYQCDFDPATLRWALQLQEEQDRKFWDEKNGGYFFTDGKDPSLLVRSKEAMDNALPNANGVSALNLLKLSDLMVNPELRRRAEQVFQAFSRLIAEYPQAFAQMLIAFDYYSDASQELAILSPESDVQLRQLLEDLRLSFHPNAVVAQSTGPTAFPSLLDGKLSLQGQATFYLCRQNTCEAPQNQGGEILNKLSEKKTYLLE